MNNEESGRVYFYDLQHIDYAWDELQTIDDWVSKKIKSDEHGRMKDGEKKIDLYKENSEEIAGFMGFIDICLKAARECTSWEGIFSQEVRILHFPSPDCFYTFKKGLIFKAPNNGSSYLISPFILDYLYRLNGGGVSYFGFLDLKRETFHKHQEKE